LSDILHPEGTTQLRIMGKGRKVRYVPLLKDVKAHLDAYIDEFHEDSSLDSFLFYTRHHGGKTQMTAANVDCMLKKYASVASKEDPSFPRMLHAHMFRHSIAMAMYKNGVPLPYIRDFLGHENLDTVRIYAYADSETIEEALKKVSHEQRGESSTEKKWKGNEDELLKYCGLA
ncbi:MAG: tyrosine-type recombinase/integrase, partial [Lachnospiraceae bacterium]|nr:tyrosine-type recombinase/integrase [Lachnospiraceae bacterium]